MKFSQRFKNPESDHNRLSVRRLLCCFSFATFMALSASAQGQHLRLAVLDLGNTNTGKSATETLLTLLAKQPQLAIVDRDLTRSAARGAGYAGSLNLSVQDARDLGAAIGCDFYLLGDAQTLRRSPSTGPPYFESYASLFAVSARSGQLVYWLRPSLTAPASDAAEKLLTTELQEPDIVNHLVRSIIDTAELERHERELAVEQTLPVIEDAPDEGTDNARGMKLPRPLRSLKPQVPESGFLTGTTVTVDLLVELDQKGEVTNVAVARWAGFGLDEASIKTARQLHFFPAMRDGVPIPIRVLLRYNFRQ